MFELFDYTNDLQNAYLKEETDLVFILENIFYIV